MSSFENSLEASQISNLLERRKKGFFFSLAYNWYSTHKNQCTNTLTAHQQQHQQQPYEKSMNQLTNHRSINSSFFLNSANLSLYLVQCSSVDCFSLVSQPWLISLLPCLRHFVQTGLVEQPPVEKVIFFFCYWTDEKHLSLYFTCCWITPTIYDNNNDG